MSRALHTGSTPARLVEFFETNPDEELTVDQVMAKFEVSEKAARMAVLRLAEKGALEYVRVVRLPAKGRAS